MPSTSRNLYIEKVAKHKKAIDDQIYVKGKAQREVQKQAYKDSEEARKSYMLERKTERTLYKEWEDRNKKRKK
jgi:hypothetical protein